jgi:hypothetical protein
VRIVRRSLLRFLSEGPPIIPPYRAPITPPSLLSASPIARARFASQSSPFLS